MTIPDLFLAPQINLLKGKFVLIPYNKMPKSVYYSPVLWLHFFAVLYTLQLAIKYKNNINTITKQNLKLVYL